jgi:hypothetical protein
MSNNIDTYAEVRVIIAPSGDLLLALPTYANQTVNIVDADDMKMISGLKLSLGCYEKLGYMIYHPQNEFSFFINSLDLFTDLGAL